MFFEFYYKKVYYYIDINACGITLSKPVAANR